MIREFDAPLNIIQAKKNDELVFESEELTPLDQYLTVKSLDETILYGPVEPDLTRDGMYYWYVTINATCGFDSVLSYYEVTISDEVTNDFADKRHIVYVNNHLVFENLITRSLGLAGHNARRFNHVWNRGLLTAYELKFYETASDLDTAIAGTGDNYIAHYSIAITYDSQYNRTMINSIIN